MKNFFMRLISILLIMPIFLYILYKANFFFYILLIIICFISFYEIFTNIKQKILSIFLYILIFLFLFCLVKTRSSEYENYILLIWILSIVWISDTFGYLIGKIFGGPKFSKYSPNKTISGFLGSIIFSQFSFLVLFFFLSNYKINFKIILLQFIICIISIFGDIFFSYLKRLNKIKDFSNFIPGHGGLLDRIDGMIFVVIFYYFILIFNVI